MTYLTQIKSLINIFKKKYLTKDIKLPLGRWKIEKCNKQINYKIDLSNEDHCGPCGQYALEIIKKKNNKIELYNKKII